MRDLFEDVRDNVLGAGMAMVYVFRETRWTYWVPFAICGGAIGAACKLLWRAFH